MGILRQFSAVKAVSFPPFSTRDFSFFGGPKEVLMQDFDPREWSSCKVSDGHHL